MLSIVSTPIGNLEDITYRAVRILKECDGIICEDTRTSKVLLDRYEIKNALTSFHAHSGEKKITEIIERLKNDEHLALISDAGTPGISDPGYILIQEALKNNIEIVPIPGPAAFLTALVASGMHTHHFLYLGFLPIKKGRQTLFLKLQEKDHTVVIYESVHRLLRTLLDIEKYFWAEHPICIGRELTKKFEQFHRGTATELQEYFTKNKPKGEFVILF